MNKFDPKQFIVLHHRALNNKAPELYKLEEETYRLYKYTRNLRRIPTLALEGDLVEVNKELFLVHNYSPAVFPILRERGQAAYFEETIEYIAKNRPETFLNIELKPGITPDGMKKAVAMLKERRLTNYLYDSFFAKELDIAHEEDPEAITSQHTIGYINGLEIPFLKSPKHTPTIKTIPYIFTIGKPEMPMIAGAVNSYKAFEEVANRENVVGSAARFGDSSLIKIINKSLSH